KQKKRANRPQTLCLSRFRRLFSFSLFCTFHFTPLILLKSQIGVFSPKKIAEQNPCDFIFFNV
ncbi:hypothetical protein, partial [Ornithobacterium rhinotracheale]